MTAKVQLLGFELFCLLSKGSRPAEDVVHHPLRKVPYGSEEQLGVCSNKVLSLGVFGQQCVRHGVGHHLWFMADVFVGVFQAAQNWNARFKFRIEVVIDDIDNGDCDSDVVGDIMSNRYVLIEEYELLSCLLFQVYQRPSLTCISRIN